MPYVRPLKYALAASRVGGSGRGTANPAYANAPLVAPTNTPLAASAVTRVTGSAANLYKAYGPNIGLTLIDYGPYAGYVYYAYVPLNA